MPFCTKQNEQKWNGAQWNCSKIFEIIHLCALLQGAAVS